MPRPKLKKKLRTGDVWLQEDERICLILDDDPELDASLKSIASFGFSFSKIIYLEKKEDVAGRYKKNYVDKLESILPVPTTLPPFNGDNQVYVDINSVLTTSNNSFKKLIGRFSDDEVLAILVAIESFDRENANRNQGKRAPAVIRESYPFDVAISFAGEERVIARDIAQGLRNSGFSVFFDEFETSTMWGSDLVQFLDVVYRKRARYCIAIISSSYKIKMWTRHELRSALARRLAEDKDYILPVRVDDTELDGLQPTTGYIRIQKAADVGNIITAFAAKLNREDTSRPHPLSVKWIENLTTINRLWGIDCTAFVVDRRYVPSSDESMEHRLGVSYGINVTVPRVGFLAPPEQQGANVLGIHVVAVHKDRTLRLEDSWHTSHRALPVEDVAGAIKQAKTYLANISDEHYQRSVSFSDSKDTLLEATFCDLDEFSNVIIDPPDM